MPVIVVTIVLRALSEICPCSITLASESTSAPGFGASPKYAEISVVVVLLMLPYTRSFTKLTREMAVVLLKILNSGPSRVVPGIPLSGG